MKTSMTLKILIPTGIFLEQSEILSIVADGKSGSFGLLPHRLDCVAVLIPGILTYRIEKGMDIYVAIDEGTLVKTGKTVAISVRNAIGGPDLNNLKHTVEEEFIKINEEERGLRLAIAKLESSFVQKFTEMHHE